MALARLLERYVSASAEELEHYGHLRQGPKAVEKLFEIAAGLDSQILGDLQIIKQVKDAYQQSCDKGYADSRLHRLMQHVLRAHKRIRHETGLGKGAASVAHAAVQFVLERVGSLQNKNLLLVGTGKIGKVTCQNLVGYRPRSLTLLNRNRDRAERIASRLEIHAGGLEALPREVAKADIVIVATGAAEPILTREHLQCPVAGHTILLDLSIPRNIAPEVAEVNNVELADLDDLNATSDAAFQERLASVPQARELIQHELGRYESWLESQQVAPTIRALQEKLEAIRTEEMKAYRNKLEEQDVQKVEQLTHRIVKKIAAHSIEHLRAHPEASDALTGMVRDMFKLELGESEGSKEDTGRG
jgi:glutamyl-tRNA reductase